MTISSSHSEQRIPELDGIRGLAILSVLVLHFGVPHTPPGGLQKTFGFGWAGVDLFFVLSGFLITGILFDSKNRASYFYSFYIRRALRIFPVYFAFVILFFDVALPLAHRLGQWGETRWSGSALFWVYLSNWQTAQSRHRWTRHLWSVSIEEQFYLVWPLVVRYTSAISLRFVCIGLCVISPVLRFACEHAGVSTRTLYQMTPFRLEGLALGSLLALIVRDESMKRRLRKALPVLSGIAAASICWLVIVAGPSFLDPVMASFGYSIIAFASFVFLSYASIMRGPALVRSSFLRQFGKYSYGIYIWHMPIAEIAIVRFHGGPLTAIAGGVGLSYAAALLSWRFIERPFLDLKDRFRPDSRASSAGRSVYASQGIPVAEGERSLPASS